MSRICGALGCRAKAVYEITRDGRDVVVCEDHAAGHQTRLLDESGVSPDV